MALVTNVNSVPSVNNDSNPPESRMAKHTPYQQNIIKNYYKNRDAIAIQRLQELVTELYLAEGKKRKKQWELIAKHLEKLEVKPDRIQYLIEKDDAELMAKVVQELDKKQD